VEPRVYAGSDELLGEERQRREPHGYQDAEERCEWT
jgi:hypothetical protein